MQMTTPSAPPPMPSNIDVDMSTQVVGTWRAPFSVRGTDVEMLLESQTVGRPISEGLRQEAMPDFFSPVNLYSPDRNFMFGEDVELGLKLQTLQLMANLYPEHTDAEEPTLDIIGSGSYNTVVGIWMPAPGNAQRDSGVAFMSTLSKFLKPARQPKPKSKDLALRLPIDEKGNLGQKDITRDVAILTVVGKHLPLPVPKIEAYDLTSNSPLTRPYMLQERIRGTCLARIWPTMNLAQKIDTITQITRMTEKIAAVTTSGAGVISNQNLDIPSSRIQVEQFPVPNDSELLRRKLSIALGTYTPPEPASAPNQTPFEYLLDHTKRWIDYDTSTGIYPETQNLWAAIQAVAYFLNQGGWLGSHFHLTHGDLFPRNIMASIHSSTSVEITAIIDWDMACFAPQVVALRPPFWAWMPQGAGDWEEDNALIIPCTREHAAVLDAFQATASEDFLRAARSVEGVIARKLFAVVTAGLLNKASRELARDLVIQWHEAYEEDGLEKFGVFFGPDVVVARPASM
jgi:aminoglycoside phosphotransferase (APT) family kinase protein